MNTPRIALSEREDGYYESRHEAPPWMVSSEIHARLCNMLLLTIPTTDT